MNNYKFERVAHKHGYDYTRNPESYGNKFIDYKIESYLNEWNITIKYTVDNDVWLDLSPDGWVYNSNSDYIVFATDTEYLFMAPAELRLLIQHNLIEKYVHSPLDARYKIWKENITNTPQTLFKLSDLENYQSFTWKF